MLQIPLQAVPNQLLSVVLDNDYYDLELNFCNSVMSCNITRNNTILQTGIRVVSGYPILPYRYQENGNFIFLTRDQEYPDYTQFGVTQFLIYYSQAEIDGFSSSGS